MYILNLALNDVQGLRYRNIQPTNQPTNQPASSINNISYFIFAFR